MVLRTTVFLLAAALFAAFPPAPATAGEGGAIYGRDLFNLAPPPPPPATAPPPPPPEVVFPLEEPADPDTLFRLVGFMAASEDGDDRGLAIILDLGRREEGFYRVGDRVAGYRVTAITGDGVELSSPLGRRYRATGNSLQPLEAPVALQRLRVRLDPLLERLESGEVDLAALRARPEHDNGELAGWEISGVSASPLLTSLGLRDYDMITAVNGVLPADGAAALDLYRRLLAGGEARVLLDLRRGGRPRQIIYYLE